jgi:hypothetical protein
LPEEEIMDLDFGKMIKQHTRLPPGKNGFS